MRTFLQTLLIIAVTFVYVVGPYLTVEMEHSHEVCHGHGHQHTGDDHDHSHHPHDQDSVPSPEAPNHDEPDSDPHSHTHLVSLGSDAQFTTASHHAFMVNQAGAFHPLAVSDFIPDGPCFPLIKPPQLG